MKYCLLLKLGNVVNVSFIDSIIFDIGVKIFSVLNIAKQYKNKPSDRILLNLLSTKKVNTNEFFLFVNWIVVECSGVSDS